MRKNIHIFIVLMFLPLATTSLFAQQQLLKVVTREVEKEYHFTDDFLLEINAEKANIEIKVVEGHTVKLFLEQSAKNADVRIAERELSYIYFVEKKERNRLYLHNYAQLKASSLGLSSIINNKYTIEVPRNCHLKIKNELGDILVDGVSTSMRFELNYCGFILNNSRGKLYVDSRIGDVTLNDCTLDGEFLTENVNLKMHRVGGSFDIQSLFGSFSCLMSDQVSLINASLEQCESTLINRTNIEYSYALDVRKARISALDENLFKKVEVETNKQHLRYKSEDAVGTIIIKSEYGDVNLY